MLWAAEDSHAEHRSAREGWDALHGALCGKQCVRAVPMRAADGPAHGAYVHPREPAGEGIFRRTSSGSGELSSAAADPQAAGIHDWRVWEMGIGAGREQRRSAE